MAKKYLDKLKYSYPLSNRAYVIAVNDEVLDGEGLPANPTVNIETGLEPLTIVIIQEAGLFNKANRTIK